MTLWVSWAACSLGCALVSICYCDHQMEVSGFQGVKNTTKYVLYSFKAVLISRDLHLRICKLKKVCRNKLKL